MSEIEQGRINDAAMIAHEANRAYCLTIGDSSQPDWRSAPNWQRESAINGAQAIVANPAMTPEQSHESWSAEKIAAGWVYGPKKDAEAKTHPCLVRYDLLPEEQQRKDALFGAVVRATLGLPSAARPSDFDVIPMLEHLHAIDALDKELNDLRGEIESLRQPSDANTPASATEPTAAEGAEA